MKKTKLIAAAVAVLTVATCATAFAACGENKEEVSTTGIYTNFNLHNHAAADNPESYTYKLEVFSDSTYEMRFEGVWAIPFTKYVTSKTVIAYGSYTVGETSETEITYNLAMPSRLQFFSLQASNGNTVTACVDTQSWPMGDPDNDIPAGFSYQANQRADIEEYETADQFLKSYGREYTIVCNTTTKWMNVEVTSHDGKQVEIYNATPKVE